MFTVSPECAREVSARRGCMAMMYRRHPRSLKNKHNSIPSPRKNNSMTRARVSNPSTPRTYTALLFLTRALHFLYDLSVTSPCLADMTRGCASPIFHLMHTVLQADTSLVATLVISSSRGNGSACGTGGSLWHSQTATTVWPLLGSS
jgi:hypothetical protein